jgi:hypothetical protein
VKWNEQRGTCLASLVNNAQRTFSKFPKSFWFFGNSSMSKQESLPLFGGLVCEAV